MRKSSTIKNEIFVTSEIGRLKRLMIHSPDSGLGKVVPSKAQDWLFEDIIHLDKMRKEEYDYYVKILLYFLDPEKIKGKMKEVDAPEANREFYKPDSTQYFKSDKVIDPQYLLSEILKNNDVKIRLVSAVCAIEKCSFETQHRLVGLSDIDLAKTLVSGSLPDKTMLFPPVPNFIFTRDIGIVINDHILLNSPAKLVRMRESLMMKYIFNHHDLFQNYRDKIIEITEDEHHFFATDEEKEDYRVTLEGGDVMTISNDHILIGCSERTTPKAVNQVISALFERNVVRKVSVIEIPAKRDFMHIDTVFTQVKRNVWVLYENLFVPKKKKANETFYQKTDADEALHVRIKQYEKGRKKPKNFKSIKDLLKNISFEDFRCNDEVKFIYSGNREFPFASREQWTDSCNVLALKEGVVVGYDRNTKTAEAFKKYGFEVITAGELLEKFEQGTLQPDDVKDTLILLPSAELSRARGGSHCMSLPLLREDIFTEIG
ncbi:MAG: amidinotransferase [Cytophagales bacterium]|nr:MAG: amidinotransferase [Cytophagales bacterium]